MTHSSNHRNSFHICNRRKKGLHLSANLDINRFKAAIIQVSFCTSFGFWGGCKLLIALVWSGFISIPLWVTIYPRNFPDPTPKEHLDAFRRNLCHLKISKMFKRSAKCSDTNLLYRVCPIIIKKESWLIKSQRKACTLNPTRERRFSNLI